MKHDTNVEERYFRYLLRLLDLDNSDSPVEFIELAKQLHKTPFVFLIPNDINRVADAFEIREEFVKTRLSTVDPSWAAMDASVFEVFIALAQRCSWQTGMSLFDWFYIFTTNLGLNDQINPITDNTLTLVRDDILARWMYRNYEKNGVGGLFPLRKPTKDQRKVEIWEQMSAYLIESMEEAGFFDS